MVKQLPVDSRCRRMALQHCNFIRRKLLLFQFVYNAQRNAKFLAGLNGSLAKIQKRQKRALLLVLRAGIEALCVIGKDGCVDYDALLWFVRISTTVERL